MSSSSLSSDDSSCSELNYPTINLQPQEHRDVEIITTDKFKKMLKRLVKHSPSEQDKDVAGSSSGSNHPRTGVGSTKRGGKKKSDEKLRKEAKKQKLAREKSSEDMPENIRIYKPEECMKYMNLEIHQALFDKFSLIDLAGELGDAGARLLTTTEDVDQGLVQWSRIVSKSYVRDEDEMKLMPVKRRCEVALYVCNAEDLAEYVQGHILSEFIAEKKRQVQISLSLVVYGLDDYFKSSRKTQDRNNKKALMTESDLEMAIADVLVSTECDVIKVNSTNELTMLLMRYTKAIAETPYKHAIRALDDRAKFYMRGDNKNCVVVDKDGTGLSRLWQQMLAILPSSSLEISRTLTDKYKSPLELFEGISKPEGVKELADIGVARAGAPGTRPRRIGPEFARKLNLLFTSQDGDLLID